MTRPTQRMIAKQLGLSPATVSLAMRDSPLIAEATRLLVQDAMRAAGYVRNVAAASLRTGRSSIVGISFHNIAHQFFAEMLIAIEETLAAAGVSVFLNNHGECRESFARFVVNLAAHGADGLLASPPADATMEDLSPLRRIGAPVVYVARRLVADDAADWVINADRMAMRRAAERLLELGHRRLALIGGQPGTTVTLERIAGFREALEGAGLTWCETLWRRCRPRSLEGAVAAQQALQDDPRPTGFVCFNNLVAFGVMNQLRAQGVQPGRDAGIVSVGGATEAAAFHPALTSVHDNPEKIGRLAANHLLARLEDPVAAPRQTVLDPQLVIRESCGGRIA